MAGGLHLLSTTHWTGLCQTAVYDNDCFRYVFSTNGHRYGEFDCPSSVQTGMFRFADFSPHADLTAQELRVLQLVGADRSNREIAEELGVAPSTVRTHLKHLYAKLGLATRPEAVRYANEHGLALG